MKRIALVAPEARRRDVLEAVARSAAVELDLPYVPGDGPDELDRASDAATASGPVVGWVGWTQARELAALTTTLGGLGAGAVPLNRPRGVQPPTSLTAKTSVGVSRTLVDTYVTVPYADMDPARPSGLAYVVMFGMMFGDVGHGAILVALGLALRSGRIQKLAKLQKTWLFVTCAGLTSMVFGALYGEVFGPTGLVPVLWLDPLDSPIPLMVAAIIFGGVLLAGSYALGTVNRIREGGWSYALYASSGIAGSLLFVALGLLVWGVVGDHKPIVIFAAVLAFTAMALLFVGFFAGAGGGATGAVQASVELVDTVIRLGSNTVSFARLAAFGLTHVALLTVVWNGTTALWGPGWRALAAILVFVVGNVLTFALEALVAGIQALRLEYYELFSRVFVSEGRQFRPWAPVLTAETHSDNPSERSLP